MRIRALLLALIAQLALFGCTKLRPNVTLENSSDARGSIDLRNLPPSCPEMPLPEYPEGLVERQLPPVSVRVDFTITEKGTIEGVRAAATEAGESSAAFEQAAVRAVSGWNCSPASRLVQETEEAPAVFKAVDYRTWVVLRFEVEEGKARAIQL